MYWSIGSAPVGALPFVYAGSGAPAEIDLDLYENESVLYSNDVVSGPITLYMDLFENESTTYLPRVARYVIPWVVQGVSGNWETSENTGIWTIHPVTDVDWEEQ